MCLPMNDAERIGEWQMQENPWGKYDSTKVERPIEEWEKREAARNIAMTPRRRLTWEECQERRASNYTVYSTHELHEHPSLWSRLKARASRVTWDSWG